MSTGEVMGQKLSKAPVYFVIAQVQFNQIMALDSYAPAIQDLFRKNGYPDTEHVSIPVFDMVLGGLQGGVQQAKQTEIKQYSFFNIERTEGFVLSNDRLSLQTTSYDVFESFSATFLKGLKLTHEVLGLALVVRTGLRYLDAVVPKENEKVSKYIDAHLLGLREMVNGNTVHSFAETVYHASHIMVTSRAMTVSAALAIPPDLQGSSLRFLPQFATISGLHAVLDNDGSISQRIPFDIGLVEKQLSEIHNEITLTFKTMVTSEALESWK